MKEFLKKLKLIDNLTIDLEIQKDEFVKRLNQSVDREVLGFFSDSFDIFSSSKNEFKGWVDSQGFEIKRRRRMFDKGANLAYAKGSFMQKGNILSIKTEIKGKDGLMFVFFILIPCFYLMFISIFIIISIGRESFPALLAAFIISFHSIFMLGIPYVIIRRGVKNLKRDLEREFYFMTKE